MSSIGARTAAILASASLACTSAPGAAPPIDAGVDARDLDAALDVDPQLRAAAEGACARRASAYCAKLASCYPPYLTIAFGGRASCEAALGIACTPSLLAPGSTTTPADLDGCARALPDADCAALFGGNDPPPACRTKPGTLADGARCGFDAQCAGTHCAAVADGCGRCATRAPSGIACDDTFGCDYGLVCANRTCVAPRGTNEACSARAPCKIPLVCGGGNCSPPLGVDQPCSPAADLCDATSGLVCIAAMCAAYTFAPRGRCGRMADGSVVVCESGTTCTFDAQKGGPVCLLPATYGSACTTDGPPCAAPSACVNGVCTLKTEATCL